MAANKENSSKKMKIAKLSDKIKTTLNPKDDEGDDYVDDRLTSSSLGAFFEEYKFDSGWLCDEELKSLERDWINVKQKENTLKSIEAQFEAMVIGVKDA